MSRPPGRSMIHRSACPGGLWSRFCHLFGLARRKGGPPISTSPQPGKVPFPGCLLRDRVGQGRQRRLFRLGRFGRLHRQELPDRFARDARRFAPTRGPAQTAHAPGTHPMPERLLSGLFLAVAGPGVVTAVGLTLAATRHCAEERPRTGRLAVSPEKSAIGADRPRLRGGRTRQTVSGQQNGYPTDPSHGKTPFTISLIGPAADWDARRLVAKGRDNPLARGLVTAAAVLFFGQHAPLKHSLKVAIKQI